MQKQTQLDSRGYCSRLSMCSYSLGVPNYKITFPSKKYPSAAPYTSLSMHFRNLVKQGSMHRTIIKTLLYPDFYTKIEVRGVRLRRHQRAHSVPLRHRRTICSSSELGEDDAGGESSTNSINFIHMGQEKVPSKESDGSTGTFVDHGPVDCTHEIFAYFDQHCGKNQQPVAIRRDSDGSFVFAHEQNDVDCDIGTRDSLKYYSKPVRVVIDRQNKSRAESLIHTTTAHLTFGSRRNDDTNTITSKGSPEEHSENSVYDERVVRTNMACEDLVNLDDSMQLKINNSPLCPKPIVDERHSMPNLLVGNRFNCSSLTEVFIPSYKESQNETTYKPMAAEQTTHSSSIDIPALIPAPDQLSTELMYNAEELPPLPTDFGLTKLGTSPTSKSRESQCSNASSSTVIKPPSMFKNASRESSPPKHATADERCVSYHFIDLPSPSQAPLAAIDDDESSKDDSKSTKSDCYRKCGCCVSSTCHSQRSSDSGMAGSCTISSPDAPIMNIDSDYVQMNLDNLNADALPRLTHSMSSHNFGRFINCDNSHDSGQFCHCFDAESASGGGNSSEGASTSVQESTLRNMFDLSLSQDTVKRQSRCKSIEQLSDPTKAPSGNEQRVKFKTGLYAHWWKKHELPNDILRDIYRLKKSQQQQVNETNEHLIGDGNQSSRCWGSGKQTSV